MPTTIYSDNFDSYTSGTALSGLGHWTAGAKYVVENTLANSGANGVDVNTLTVNQWAYVSDTDGNSGNAQASVNWQVATQASCVGGVHCRTTTPSTVDGSSTGYKLNVSTATGVQLFKDVSGTSTQLGSTVGAGGLATSTWYNLLLNCNGTTISVQIQRLSDSMYYTSAASWQAGQTYCVSVTDSSISGVGHAGLRCSQSSTGVQYFDDFLFQSLDAAFTWQPLTSFFDPPSWPRRAAADQYASPVEPSLWTAPPTLSWGPSFTWAWPPAPFPTVPYYAAPATVEIVTIDKWYELPRQAWPPLPLAVSPYYAAPVTLLPPLVWVAAPPVFPPRLPTSVQPPYLAAPVLVPSAEVVTVDKWYKLPVQPWRQPVYAEAEAYAGPVLPPPPAIVAPIHNVAVSWASSNSFVAPWSHPTITLSWAVSTSLVAPWSP